MTDAQSTPQARPLLSYRDLALLFYIGVPSMFAVSFGWLGAGDWASHFSRPVSILYWFGAAGLLWATLEITTRFVAKIAPKGMTPLVFVLLAGGLLQPLIGRPILNVWQSLFVGFFPPGVEIPLIKYFYDSLPDYGAVLMSNTVIIIVWITFNLLFDRVLGYPRFRQASGFNPDSNVWRDTTERIANLVPSGLLLRIPPALGTDVIALSAEDHYVRVYTKLGNDLILYRFSDAVREMPDDIGLQVHRSHWVNLSAITKFEESGRSYILSVNESVSIPVSQRYIEVLKGRGITPDRTD